MARWEIDRLLQGGRWRTLNQDSFDVLQGLPEDSVDLILTDPPYDFDEHTKIWLHDEFLRVSKGAVIVFSPPENQWVQPADQYLFWEKPISTKNTSRRYSRFIEMIFVYRETCWVTGRHWSQYTNVFKDLVDDAKIHPYRKPPSMIKRLMLNHTKPGMIIFDPFAGSGVVGEVARDNDRKAILIEKDKTKYETMQRRMRSW